MNAAKHHTFEERTALVAVALEAARGAAQIALSGWRNAPVVEHKRSFTDLVTEFDRPIRTVEDLVDELRAARCRPVDFRNRPVT